MAVTAIELIRGAIRLLGKKSEAEMLSAEDAQDCLFALNEMMDAWAIKRFMVYQIKQDLLTWPAAAVSRTIGIGGQLNVARPIKLEPGCFMRDSFGQDYELEILTDREEYDGLRQKTLPLTEYYQAIYFEPSFPLGVLYLWPPPSAQATIGLNSRQPLQAFLALLTPLSLPPGYQVCIRSNLALALAPEFLGDNQPPGAVIEMARSSKSALASINAPMQLATCEIAYISGRNSGWDYNVRSGSGRN